MEEIREALLRDESVSARLFPSNLLASISRSTYGKASFDGES